MCLNQELKIDVAPDHPEHPDDGCTKVHAEQEPVAREARRGRAERQPHEGGDTASIREAGSQRRERPGQRDREQHHRDDGQDRGRTGRIRTEAREHEDAGAEHCSDVQSRAADQPEPAMTAALHLDAAPAGNGRALGEVRTIGDEGLRLLRAGGFCPPEDSGTAQKAG